VTSARFFDLWLIDPSLITDLMAWRLSAGDVINDALLLGTIKWHSSKRNPLTAEIDYLQAWFRLNLRTPSRLREQLGNLEAQLEFGFRTYAAALGYTSVSAPTGSHYLDRIGNRRMHPNTILRLDRLFYDAGYHPQRQGPHMIWHRSIAESA
jgi:hypothetical protein